MSGYISRLRKLIGSQKILHPAARILVENDKGEFLLVEKQDRNRVALPAGAMEEGESLEECIRREVREETGLELGKVMLIGLSSNPANETVTYPNGDVVQYVSAEFYANTFSGELTPADTGEIIRAYFRPKEWLERIPQGEKSILKSWEYFQQTGQVRLS